MLPIAPVESRGIFCAQSKKPGATLTPDSSDPKMTRRIAGQPEVPMSRPNESIASLNLFRAIATDVHFWIPLIVLVGGLILLDTLR